MVTRLHCSLAQPNPCSALEARDARIADLERELDAARDAHHHREAQLQGSCQS